MTSDSSIHSIHSFMDRITGAISILSSWNTYNYNCTTAYAVF